MEDFTWAENLPPTMAIDVAPKLFGISRSTASVSGARRVLELSVVASEHLAPPDQFVDAHRVGVACCDAGPVNDLCSHVREFAKCVGLRPSYGAEYPSSIAGVVVPARQSDFPHSWNGRSDGSIAINGASREWACAASRHGVGARCSSRWIIRT